MDALSERPKRFGKYRLLRKIGMGGMAEVYLAEDARDPSRRIAIKKIIADLSRNKKLISMLVNEAKLAMMLNHPNIVPIYDFGLIDNHYFMAMEYVEGKDLRDFLKKAYSEDRKIPLEVVLYAMVSLLEGLDYAHIKKDNFNKPLEIIHRDISPQNIMISYDGDVKILDFGIAKAKGSLTETQAGILKGKFSYMSPEQARGKELDQRSDIFSAGVIFHELLTVKSLFGDQSEIRTIEKVRRAKVPDPRQLNPGIPNDLARIVMKALSKWKWMRYQTARAFQESIISWSAKNGMTINRDVVREYISKEFPPSLEEKIHAVTDKAPTAVLAKIPLGKMRVTGVVDDTYSNALEEDTPKDSLISGDISLKSLPRSTYSYVAHIKRILSLKTLVLLTLPVLLALLIAYMGRFGYYELASKAYEKIVLMPREKISGYMAKKDEDKLPFEPMDFIYMKPKILLSEKAKKTLFSFPLERFDRVMGFLNSALESGRLNSLKRIEFDRLTFDLKKEPEGDLTIESIR